MAFTAKTYSKVAWQDDQIRSSKLSMVYLTDIKPLLLEDDSQILFHPLRVEVFGGTGLQLKGVLLKILKPDPKKYIVRCINCLDTVLRINAR